MTKRNTVKHMSLKMLKIFPFMPVASQFCMYHIFHSDSFFAIITHVFVYKIYFYESLKNLEKMFLKSV